MERSIIAESNNGKRDLLFLRGILFLAAGLVLSLTRLFGNPAPFAAACLYSVGGIESLFMFVGAAIGFTINGGFVVCVPYIAAMGAILLIRYSVNVFLGNTRSEFVRIICSAAIAVGIFAANLFIANDVYDIFIAIVFAILSGIAAYCTDKLKIVNPNSISSLRNTGTAAAFGILFIMLIAALTSLQIGVINIGVTLSALSVLYVSDVRVGASSAVIAVLSSAGIAAGNGELAASCIMISVTAPVIMLLDNYGKITKSCAFIAIVGLGLIITGADEINGTATISAASAGIIYMAVPDSLLPFSKIKSRVEVTAAPRPYAAFGQKLGTMSTAIDDMKKAVIHTAKALAQENTRDISWVYNKAADTVCKTCPTNMTCWGQLYGDTSDIMNKAVEKLRNGNFISRETLGGHLAGNCIRRDELAAALNRQYAAYCSAESSSRKVEEMRNVLTNQLGATENLLRKMSEELEQNDTYDEKAASAAEKLLTELGMKRPAVIAMKINGRLSIDAYGTGNLSFPPEEIADRLAFELHKEFDLPVISENGDKFHFTVSERARFDTEIRIFKKNKSGSRHSGDCSDCFNDGRGNIYMILSDGMGSGSRARIDSTFSCNMLEKMLKAGIDLDSSLEMLNSSLLVKSSDESFATLDLCKIDLNTGEVLLCKAGGAATYVRSGNTFNEIKEDGLPLGTGFEANYRGKLFRLNEGDIVIMTSDGADIDRGWIEQLVMREKHPDINLITETIGEALKLSVNKDTEDDMTVIGVKLIR